MDYTIKIGGEAGQGIQTIGYTLARVFSRAGFHVFTHQDYESRIRGGHNFFQIRFSDGPVMASRDRIDILVALDKESILSHERELTEYGQIIYDSSMIGNPPIPPLEKGGKRGFLDIPFVNLAIEHGGNKIMANTVATGAVLGMLKIRLDILFEIIKNTFKKKGEDIVKTNINAATAGHNYAIKECIQCFFSAIPISNPKMLISGVDAIGLGAISSGCKFYSAYPMTPSTGIMNYLASKEKDYGIIVEQAEDEIAAINMALGASFTGVRAMTGTPIVIALGQRPAPATGLPTRTEQADLLFAIHTAHGEFPRVIFAPGTPEQAFYLTNKAFDIAEKYQVPAFVIFDQYLADSEWTFEEFDLSKIKFNDYRIRRETFKSLKEYKRHVFTETGISPLGVPGDSKHLVVTDSDEHNNEGHIIEDAETRVKMVNKRLFRKLPLIRQEIEPPSLYGSSQPEIVVAGWGSTYGVMRESGGRTLPVATGIRLSNHEMLVIAVAGDGDYYGEGGNHLIHAMRRNINVKLFVHDNQIYGLTKGQASPTSLEGMITKNQPFGVFSEQLNPIALAIAIDCSFVARGFAGDMEHLKELMKAAILHKGFSLVDILQPCVTFNKINTYEWYRQRVYHIEPEHNPEDRVGAFKKALEWGERIPIGIIYKNHRPVLEEKIPVIRDNPLVRQSFDMSRIETTLKEFC